MLDPSFKFYVLFYKFCDAGIYVGKLVITVPADGSDAVATLTATLTAGDSTDTVSFTLNMSLPKNLSVLEAIG